VVVDVGVTFTADPLVAVMLPGVITPVPLEKVGVRFAEPPTVMVERSTVKLLIEGAPTTVTEVV